MASRVAISSLRAAARPVAAARPFARCISTTPSNADQPPPAERASQIINKLPSSPNLITKTGTALLGTGLAAAAISQELYVVNEETIILVGTFIVLGYLAKALSGPYAEWAESKIQHMKDVLNGARREHVEAVKERIGGVEGMKDVVGLTKGLFALSKAGFFSSFHSLLLTSFPPSLLLNLTPALFLIQETATLEASSFVLKQKVAMASELKAVLDSWVRYEQQVKESEQAELTNRVIDNVLKSLTEEKTQKDVLSAAVAEVELMVKNKAI